MQSQKFIIVMKFFIYQTMWHQKSSFKMDEIKGELKSQ